MRSQPGIAQHRPSRASSARRCAGLTARSCASEVHPRHRDVGVAGEGRRAISDGIAGPCAQRAHLSGARFLTARPGRRAPLGRRAGPRVSEGSHCQRELRQRIGCRATSAGRAARRPLRRVRFPGGEPRPRLDRLDERHPAVAGRAVPEEPHVPSTPQNHSTHRRACAAFATSNGRRTRWRAARDVPLELRGRRGGRRRAARLVLALAGARDRAHLRVRQPPSANAAATAAGRQPSRHAHVVTRSPRRQRTGPGQPFRRPREPRRPARRRDRRTPRPGPSHTAIRARSPAPLAITICRSSLLRSLHPRMTRTHVRMWHGRSEPGSGLCRKVVTNAVQLNRGGGLSRVGGKVRGVRGPRRRPLHPAVCGSSG